MVSGVLAPSLALLPVTLGPGRSNLISQAQSPGSTANMGMDIAQRRWHPSSWSYKGKPEPHLGPSTGWSRGPDPHVWSFHFAAKCMMWVLGAPPEPGTP